MPATAQQLSPENPFYAVSTLPFQAPPFDKIKDTDYQPAIEAGIAEQLREIDAIANNPAPPDFANTIVAYEKCGQLLRRVRSALNAVGEADTNPALQAVDKAETPKLTAAEDSIVLNPKLFDRIKAIYDHRAATHLDAQQKRLVEVMYDRFVHAGANLNDADKTRLKQLNGQLALLSNEFRDRLLAATKAGAFVTTDKAALAGLSDGQIAPAAQAAKRRGVEGYLIPLQNTTLQPVMQLLGDRATRKAIFDNSWNRTERGGDTDTRDTVAQLAKLRAERAKLLGYPDFAAWKIEDQMAETPETALKFMDALVGPSTAKAMGEAKDIQALIDKQNGGFKLAAYDWDFYADQVRKARYDLDESQVRPYFELNTVLKDGVFYAATQLYGITFKERTDTCWPPMRRCNRRTPSRQPHSRRRSSPSTRCRPATGQPTSSTSSPEDIRPDTTPTCGARCSTTTPSPGSPSTAASPAPTATASAPWSSPREAPRSLNPCTKNGVVASPPSTAC
jgi:peptidyl-dipeptidase Dcp